MEEGIPYIATLNQVIVSGSIEPIIKEVTHYLRTNPSGITVRRLIDYLLVVDDDFNEDDKDITSIIRADIKKSTLDIDDIRDGLKLSIRDLIKIPNEILSKLAAKDLHGGIPIDYFIDRLFKAGSFGIYLVDCYGKERTIPENSREKRLKDVDFLLKTAIAASLFEIYQREGRYYMGLNLVVVGSRGTIL